MTLIFMGKISLLFQQIRPIISGPVVNRQSQGSSPAVLIALFAEYGLLCIIAMRGFACYRLGLEGNEV
jgi:hypothetical protein